jgi:enamine deaminase RidA (YjgF/YER057c/UK114 family)
MFANAEAALAAAGLSYGHVVRTWLYLARLLEWYRELNRVRSAHYAPVGFGTGPGSRPFPASTGIQGRSGAAECFMDLLALESTVPGAATARPLLRSARQGESIAYGSAFSRGMTLAIEGRRTVHVSGTASIDAGGRTVHVDDREGQALETLLCVGSLLEEAGGGLGSIVSSTLFCKDREALEAFRRVTRLLRVPAFPVVPVLADVCRPDLLVELEAVAVV